MAPKTGESSRKGKGKTKASTFESWEMERFISKAHQDHFYDVVAKKKVIPEVPFKLKRNEYPEIRHEIQRRGWEVLTNPIQQVGILMVQEFYANAWITKNHDQSKNPDPKNYVTMVRGKYLDFSPENVRLAFNLPYMEENARPYRRRVNFDQRLDQVLIDICEEGAQWKRDSRGKPVQLRRHDLKPITKKRVEQIREPHQEHEEIPHHEIPEMPQGMHFPPQNYWEQINTFQHGTTKGGAPRAFHPPP